MWQLSLQCGAHENNYLCLVLCKIHLSVFLLSLYLSLSRDCAGLILLLAEESPALQSLLLHNLRITLGLAEDAVSHSAKSGSTQVTPLKHVADSKIISEKNPPERSGVFFAAQVFRKKVKRG